ncbi:17273_t:CDS:2 [Cetraspora pellucida]|uniref:17273_t:CDS:1 n=1 Tax=Cetraspora pellucida TaxID=1433469 RepID=A0A9N9I8J5_9GLOM|nr:17273_t:CDS:2 [Cetraspora pellucida]
MGKQPYHLLEFIIMLDEKANKSNKFCVCQECVIGSSYKDVYNNRFANTQGLVHPFQESIDDNSATESEVSLVASSLQSDKFRSKKNRIDRYLLWPLSEDQQKHFKQLLLKATVSCSLAFFWIKNPEIKVLFEFLYLPVKLPLQKKLGGRILAEYAQNITKSIKEIAQSNKNSVTLAYDGWKNIKKESIFRSVLITSKGKILVWSAKDISNECMKWPDVQCRTENMLDDLKKKK